MSSRVTVRPRAHGRGWPVRIRPSPTSESPFQSWDARLPHPVPLEPAVVEEADRAVVVGPDGVEVVDERVAGRVLSVHTLTPPEGGLP